MQKANLESSPANQDDRLNQARLFLEQSDFVSALGAINRAMLDASDDRKAECFALRGYAHLKKGEFQDAEFDCAQAIEIGGGDSQTHAWRAAARGEQNLWRAAFDDLHRAHELSDGDSNECRALMDAYSESASQWFREVIKQGGESAELFFERGWVYFRCGKFEKASRDFKYALRLDARHAWAAAGLGQVMVRMAQRKGLMKLCDIACQGDESCERIALGIRAGLRQEKGDAEGARRDFDRLYELSGGDVDAMLDCIRRQHELGDFIGTIQRVVEVIGVSPGCLAAIRIRGKCYQAIGQHALAVKDYSECLRHFPDDSKLRLRRASGLVELGRYDAAQDDLAQVPEHSPLAREANEMMAQIFLSVGKPEASLDACRRAIQLNQRRMSTRLLLGEIYSRLGESANAAEEFGRSLELAVTDEERSVCLFQRGMARVSLEDDELAASDFGESIQLRPENQDAWIGKAYVDARMEHWLEVVASLGHAIDCHAVDSELVRELGRSASELLIRSLDRQRETGTAVENSYRLRGVANQFLGEVQAAIDDFSQSLDADSGDVESRLRRGQAFASQGDYALATKDFSELIGRDSENHNARYQRACVAVERGSWVAAHSDLVKAIQASPDDSRYHALTGRILMRLGKTRDSIVALNTAISLDGFSTRILNQRGQASAEVQDDASAILDFSRSLELCADQPELHTFRGQAFLRTGQTEMAIKDFEFALSRDFHAVNAYAGRASIMVSQGKFGATLIWLTKALHRFSRPQDLAEILFSRGKAYFQMGRLAPAISDFSSAIELIRTDKGRAAEFRYARAIANVQSGHLEIAKKDFERWLDINPNDEGGIQALEWLDDRNGDCPEILSVVAKVQRPLRPPVNDPGIRLVESIDRWANSAPFNDWIVRTESKQEFGPVRYDVLMKWISEGRVGPGMKVLRADWSRWKRIERVFVELAPQKTSEIDLGRFPGVRTT